MCKRCERGFSDILNGYAILGFALYRGCVISRLNCNSKATTTSTKTIRTEFVQIDLNSKLQLENPRPEKTIEKNKLSKKARNKKNEEPQLNLFPRFGDS